MSKPTASSRPFSDSPSTSDTTAPSGAKSTSKARCPICRAPTEPDFRPFCSRRCADVDLSRWLKGAYAIPGNVEVDEDGDDSQVAASSRQPSATPDDDDEDEPRR